MEELGDCQAACVAGFSLYVPLPPATYYANLSLPSLPCFVPQERTSKGLAADAPDCCLGLANGRYQNEKGN